MAVSYSDKRILANNITFQDRVRQSLLSACVNIKSELTTVSFHRERETFLVAVMNSPEIYKVLFAMVVANDASVIGDATAAGTVALTTANADAQQALVTDVHMDTAVSAGFNAFFRTPAT